MRARQRLQVRWLRRARIRRGCCARARRTGGGTGCSASAPRRHRPAADGRRVDACRTRRSRHGQRRLSRRASRQLGRRGALTSVPSDAAGCATIVWRRRRRHHALIDTAGHAHHAQPDRTARPPHACRGTTCARAGKGNACAVYVREVPCGMYRLDDDPTSASLLVVLVHLALPEFTAAARDSKRVRPTGRGSRLHIAPSPKSPSPSDALQSHAGGMRRISLIEPPWDIPARLDLRHTDESTARLFFADYFSAKSEHGAAKTAGFFSADAITYSDAPLGWAANGKANIEVAFQAAMPRWQEGRSNPTAIARQCWPALRGA